MRCPHGMLKGVVRCVVRDCEAAHKPGDRLGKACPKCQTFKPLTEFSVYSNTGKHYSSCRECWARHMRGRARSKRSAA